MKIDHVAIWTDDLERLKEYYVKYFGGRSGSRYVNTARGFESYFLSFESGSRLELMSMPGIPANLNDTRSRQYIGLIHLSFGVENMIEVEKKAAELAGEGFEILKGPRKTGDGYYEFETLDPDGNRLEVSSLYQG